MSQTLKTALFGAALALFSMPALADGMDGPRMSPRLSMKDAPAAHSYSHCAGQRFSGFYAGGTLGGTSHTSKWQETYADFYPDYQDMPLNVTKNSLSGGIGVGYNVVRCNTLFGVEGDFNFAHTKHTTDHYPATAGTGYATFSDSIRSYMTLRGRVGFVVDRTLFYATGGLAFADLKHSMRDIGHFDGTAPFDYDFSGWRRGYVVGAGFEHALTDIVSLKAEALYMKFASKNYDGSDNPAPGFPVDYYTFKSSNDVWTARIGLNIKLGAPPRHIEPASYEPPPPAKVAPAKKMKKSCMGPDADPERCAPKK